MPPLWPPKGSVTNTTRLSITHDHVMTGTNRTTKPWQAFGNKAQGLEDHLQLATKIPDLQLTSQGSMHLHNRHEHDHLFARWVTILREIQKWLQTKMLHVLQIHHGLGKKD